MLSSTSFQRAPLLPTAASDTAAQGPVRPNAPSRWLRRSIAIAGGFVGVLAIVALSGAAFETIATNGDASAYPLSGRMIDIGGYSLHLDCRGAGSPTVVMDAGLGGSSLDWTLVQSELATTTQVCTYDRAGMGWSDAGPMPRSPAHIADELHLLLRNAGLSGPFVLVGHSLAGKNIRMFASMHASEVAGMVLVDARSERIDAAATQADVDGFAAALKGQALMYSVARHLGLARLLGASLVGEPLLAPDIATEVALLQTQPAAIEETTAEGLARSTNDAALAATTLGSIPLMVVAAEASMTEIPGWAAAQQGLAELSSDGHLIVAKQSGHAVQLEDPSIVIDAVRTVLVSARNEL
jgi:pimeloyl-ACP methyl ester carboxylesterase